MPNDLKNNLTVTSAVHPATLTADGTVVSVDRQGSGAVLAVVQLGALTTVDVSNYFEFKLQESDDGSTFTDVVAADLIGGTTNVIVRANGVLGVANTSYTLGYKGNKRYVGVLADETGTSTIIAGAVIIEGGLSNVA